MTSYCVFFLVLLAQCKLGKAGRHRLSEQHKLGPGGLAELAVSTDGGFKPVQNRSHATSTSAEWNPWDLSSPISSDDEAIDEESVALISQDKSVAEICGTLTGGAGLRSIVSRWSPDAYASLSLGSGTEWVNNCKRMIEGRRGTSATEFAAAALGNWENSSLIADNAWGVVYAVQHIIVTVLQVAKTGRFDLEAIFVRVVDVIAQNVQASAWKSCLSAKAAERAGLCIGEECKSYFDLVVCVGTLVTGSLALYGDYDLSAGMMGIVTELLDVAQTILQRGLSGLLVFKFFFYISRLLVFAFAGPCVGFVVDAGVMMIWNEVENVLKGTFIGNQAGLNLSPDLGDACIARMLQFYDPDRKVPTLSREANIEWIRAWDELGCKNKKVDYSIMRSLPADAHRHLVQALKEVKPLPSSDLIDAFFMQTTVVPYYDDGQAWVSPSTGEEVTVEQKKKPDKMEQYNFEIALRRYKCFSKVVPTTGPPFKCVTGQALCKEPFVDSEGKVEDHPDYCNSPTACPRANACQAAMFVCTGDVLLSGTQLRLDKWECWKGGWKLPVPKLKCDPWFAG